jgi:hypothetical protein
VWIAVSSKLYRKNGIFDFSKYKNFEPKLVKSMVFFATPRIGNYIVEKVPPIPDLSKMGGKRGLFYHVIAGVIEVDCDMKKSNF